MLTVHFLYYMIAVFFAYMFKLSYLGWFGAYLLAAVIFVPILLLLLSLPVMLSAKLALEAVPYCARGSNTDLQLVFKVSRYFPIGSVKVQVEIINLFAEEKSKESHVFHSVCSGKKSIPLPTDLCGTLCCRVTRLDCRDVLGIFALKRACPEDCYCTVLPEAREPDAPIHVDAALQTPARLKPKYGGGYSEEHDLRQYRPGDTVNTIHWKLSSKMDDVIVREPLVRENQDVYVVLARVGANDRGLEVLYWLSQALCDLEVPHTIVADRQYSVGNQTDTIRALCGILNTPIVEPCSYDAANARCVFLITSGEVHVA